MTFLLSERSWYSVRSETESFLNNSLQAAPTSTWKEESNDDDQDIDDYIEHWIDKKYLDPLSE